MAPTGGRARLRELAGRERHPSFELVPSDKLVTRASDRAKDLDVVSTQELGPDPPEEDRHRRVLTVAFDDGDDTQSAHRSSLKTEMRLGGWD